MLVNQICVIPRFLHLNLFRRPLFQWCFLHSWVIACYWLIEVSFKFCSLILFYKVCSYFVICFVQNWWHVASSIDGLLINYYCSYSFLYVFSLVYIYIYIYLCACVLETWRWNLNFKAWDSIEVCCRALWV